MSIMATFQQSILPSQPFALSPPSRHRILGHFGCVAKRGHDPLLPIALSRDTDFPAILGVSREDFLEKGGFSCSDTGKTPVSECVVGIEDQWCVAKRGHEPLRPIAPSRDTDFLAILGVSREDFLEKGGFSGSDTGKTRVSECVVGIEDQWCVARNRKSMVCRETRT